MYNGYIGIIDLLICDIVYVVELEWRIGSCVFDRDLNLYIVRVDIIFRVILEIGILSYVVDFGIVLEFD